MNDNITPEQPITSDGDTGNHEAIVAELKTKVEEANARATSFENRFRDAEMTSALHRAAIHSEAFNVNQIVVLLKPTTKLVETVDAKTGAPTGEYRAVVTVDGKEVSPQEALRGMKQTQPNLFKANVDISKSPQPQPMSAAELVRRNPAAFRKALKESPEKLGLGLRPKPRRLGR